MWAGKAPRRSSEVQLVLTLALLSSLSLVAILPARAAAGDSVPLPGASVTASSQDIFSTGSYASAASGADGSYTLHIYVNGTQTVDVEASGSGPYLSSGETLTVSPGSDLSNASLTLQRGGVLSGRVTSPSGAPVRGALVTASTAGVGASNSTCFLTTSSDVTDLAGLYWIDDLCSGTYNVEVVPGFAAGVSPDGQTPGPDYAYSFPGFLRQTSSAVSVTAGEASSLNVVLSNQSGAIQGRVLGPSGQALSGVGVRVEPVSGQGLTSQVTSATNESGYYEIANNLPSGSYNVSLFSTGPSHFLVTGSKVVSVTSGRITNGADFRLGSTSAVISGTVTDAAGTPLAGYEVQAESSNFETVSNATDSSGHYVLSGGMATGVYNVTASPGSRSALPFDELGEATVSGVSATEGEQSTVNIVIHPASAIIVGTVTDGATGSPVAGAQVGATTGPFPGSANVTDSNGNYLLRVVVPYGANPDYAVLTVNATGFEPVTLGDIYTGSVQLSPGQRTTEDVALTPAAPTPNSSPNAIISGTIEAQTVDMNPPERTTEWQVPSYVHSPSVSSVAVVTTDSDLGFVDLFDGRVGAYVNGPVGVQADLTVAVSTELMTGPWTATVDGSQLSAQVVSQNSTYTLLKVGYPGGQHFIEFAGSSSGVASTTSSTTERGGSTSQSSTTSVLSSVTSGSAASTTAGGAQGGQSWILWVVVVLVVILVAGWLVRRRSSRGEAKGPRGGQSPPAPPPSVGRLAS